MKRIILVFTLALISSANLAQSLSEDCFKNYNKAQKDWMEAQEIDKKFSEDGENFVNGEQTCKGLVDLINQNVDVQEALEKAFKGFENAQLKCEDGGMPGYARSASLKQDRIKSRIGELQELYNNLKAEAIRAGCIKGPDVVD